MGSQDDKVYVQARRMLREGDTNGDGLVCKEEFTHLLQARAHCSSVGQLRCRAKSADSTHLGCCAVPDDAYPRSYLANMRLACLLHCQCSVRVDATSGKVWIWYHTQLTALCILVQAGSVEDSLDAYDARWSKNRVVLGPGEHSTTI